MSKDTHACILAQQNQIVICCTGSKHECIEKQNEFNDLGSYVEVKKLIELYELWADDVVSFVADSEETLINWKNQ